MGDCLNELRVACLVPLYNHEESLGRAIESVMMQKAPFRYKMIIVDDGSTDRSLQVAQEYQGKYPDKIEVYSNGRNMGLLRTTANAYKHLKGYEYFCVLDPDDWYIYDHKFADAVAFLDAHPSYTVYLTGVQWKTPEDEAMKYTGGGVCLSTKIHFS